MTSSDSPPVAEPPYWAVEIDELVGRLRFDLGALPYDPTPPGLYSADDLYAGFGDGGFAATVDRRIHLRAQRAGDAPVHPIEALAQRLHDHGITVALDEFRADRLLVGVMGGHGLERGSRGYRQVVEVGRRLTQAGFCVVTGGGPGAMEAANLGAAAADVDASVVDEVIDRMAKVRGSAAGPDAAGLDAFVAAALDARAELAARAELRTNLSVPTWFYGQEPSNPFATHIAKYFSNSEREAGLLAIAQSGIVFVPGGPGTLQEVFQDGAQNAYETYGAACPMVFLDHPHDPGWWERSGVLVTLDGTFVDEWGRSRAGRDLVVAAASVDSVLEVLLRYRDAPRSPLSLRSTTSTRGGAS